MIASKLTNSPKLMIQSPSQTISTHVHFWDRLTYLEAQKLQEEAWAFLKDGSEGLFEIVLGGEVELVVTQGVRANPSHIHCPNLAPIQTKRGGETTLHAPGQLLIYPVVSLRKLGMGIKDYIQVLLEVSAQTFQDFSVPATWSWEPLGVWTSEGKIGFCGVQVLHGLTQHGLALNLTNDLTLFSKITSCGIQKANYDKAFNYDTSINLKNFFYKWCENFEKSWESQKS